MRITSTTGIDFDDVLLMPRHSTISSRFDGEIDLSTQLLPNLNLKYPILSANMDTITGEVMAQTINELGGLGIIHRFMPVEQHSGALNYVSSDKRVLCLGVGDKSLARLRAIHAACSLAAILIDIAHGDSSVMLDMIAATRELTGNKIPIIAGNIATAAAAERLISAGASCLKVGVGSGKICKTRHNTGAGVYQLTAIDEVKRAIRSVNEPITLIADGGIRSAGDVVKALAAGADAVMIGSLFAGTDETPGEIFQSGKGGMMKVYRGMASQAAQRDWKGFVTSIEGESIQVPWQGSVRDVFDNLINNISSGMSYQNAHTIAELQQNATFIMRC